ncbi:Cytochrome P450 4d2 [Eumeta japonica]|uniref:Cytochrome P450 4d2 n=1 Tax=Eumeta variegata TaxID=151549 RepID=A0A4C1V2X1_EUMVA|nr:Cytochrome P450 4d2 [Eumeta japonica]
MLALLLLLAALCWYGMFRWRRRRLYELAALIPRSARVPAHRAFTQNFRKHPRVWAVWPAVAVAFTCAHPICTDVMKTVQEHSRFAMKNDGYCKLWLGPKLYIGIVNPVDLEFLLKTCLEKDDMHRFIRAATGNGGVFAPVTLFHSDSVLTLDYRLVLNFGRGPAFHCHPGSVFDSALRLAFNSDSGTNHSCDLNENWVVTNSVTTIETHGSVRFGASSLVQLELQTRQITTRSVLIDPLYFDYNGTDCTVSIWRPRRKIMAPTFSPRILEQFVEIFAEQSDVLSRRLAAQSDGAPLSAWPLISAYALDSVCGKYSLAVTLM